MRSTFTSKPARRSREAGQVMLFTILGLGLFMIGAAAFAIDLSNMWFNRQSAQTAADAACTAAVMDMLVGATNGTMPAGANFTAGTAFGCNASDPTPKLTSAPCQYANLNGFGSGITQSNAISGTLGDNVSVDFPAASGVVCMDGTNCLANVNFPPASVAASSLVRVKVISNVPTWFAGLLKGMTKQGTGATAICGVIQATSPIPILVLNPTVSNSFSTQGNPDVSIVGGPSKSIQVNSSSASAVNIGGSADVNLCAAGGSYCGSAMGIWGSQAVLGGFYHTTATCASNRPAGAPACSATQAAPQWNSPSAPIADPFATQPAPSVPTNAGVMTLICPQSNPGCGGVAFPGNGCPDAAQGCNEYSPGNYPSGIKVKNVTAIFDPGIYYMAGNPCGGSTNASLCTQSNSCVRPSTATGDGSGGTIFYFADTNGYSVQVGANAGCSGVTAFNTTSGTGSLANGIRCIGLGNPGATVIPSNIPATLTGSVLLAPCQKPTVTSLCASLNSNANCNINFGDPLGAGDPNGEQRGILFFQDRAVNASNNPSWGGGGSTLVAGTMYFHQCVTSGADTGQGCVSSAFHDVLQLQGGSGSNTYVLGDIIVDQMQLGGNSSIIMDLNPTAAFTTLKASLLQ